MPPVAAITTAFDIIVPQLPLLLACCGHGHHRSHCCCLAVIVTVVTVSVIM
jgi:hypothetical protein